MKWRFYLCLRVAWVAVSIVVTTVHGCVENCPHKTSNPGPLVTPTNGHDILRVGRTKLFSCCSAGFTNISWYFQQNASLTWIAIIPAIHRVQICNDGQNLQISDLTMKDQGQYRCIVTNGTATVGAYYTLELLDCDSMLHHPKVTVAPHNIPAKVGDSITFPCEGFFGCGEQFLKPIMWYSKNSERNEYFKAGNHYNYIYTMYNRSNFDFVGANLVIDPVMKENFSQTYFCVLGVEKKLNVTILHSDAIVKALIDKEHLIIISCACILVIVIVITITICCWLHFPRISFWCNTKCNKFPREGDFTYDTALVCIEQDVPIVRERLLPVLKENLGYRVYFNPEDMPMGRGETIGEAGMFPQTYCAIMFVSKESLEENAFKFVCQSAMCLVGGPYMILIKKEDIPQSVWKSVPRDLERRLKIIQTLTLPDVCTATSNEESSQFWRSLQSKLPKPQTKRQTSRVVIDRDSYSNVPLLSNRISSVSQPVSE